MTEKSSSPNPEGRSFIQDVVLNAVEPGVNHSVLVFLNTIFVLLLCTLVAVTVLTGLNIHIILLGVLTLGLLLGLNW